MQFSISCAITRAALFVAALVTVSAFGQAGSTLTGQWDFNQGDLRATVGTNLQYFGNIAETTTFETVVVNGNNGNVMRFPAADPTQGYLMFHGAQPNGGGTNVSLYTLVMDILWPSESDGAFRALFNTDTNNVADAVMFVNPDNGVGINNDYAGEMFPDTWYRLALAFNLNPTNSTVTKYLNGTNAFVQVLDAGVDSQFSVGRALLLLTSGTGETRSGLLDRVQFYSDALSEEQIAALGSPLGDGGPPVTGDFKIESIRKVGNDVEITVTGSGTLQLQRKVRLSDPAWQPAAERTGSGTFTVPATEATGFFRAAKL